MKSTLLSLSVQVATTLPLLAAKRNTSFAYRFDDRLKQTTDSVIKVTF